MNPLLKTREVAVVLVVVKVLQESGNLYLNGSKNSLPKLLTPFPVLPATMQHAVGNLVTPE